MATPKTFKEPAFRRGENLRAESLNLLRRAIPMILTGGRGINVKYIGGRIIIEKTGNPIIPS